MNAVRKLLAALILAAALMGCFALGACAGSDAIGDCCGVWVGDGVAVELWREQGELRCRAVFLDGDGESDVWTYNVCLSDETGASLEFGGVTRTHEYFDSLMNALVEADWSMDDLSYCRLERTEFGLRFSGDGLDAPIALVRLSDAGAGDRTDALAYVGHWTGEFATLRVEDRGVACLFTVSVPVDDDSTCEWTYTCLYDAAGKRMVSRDVSNRRIITREADGGTSEVDGEWDVSEAVFTLEDGNRLIWNDVTDGDGESYTFCLSTSSAISR